MDHNHKKPKFNRKKKYPTRRPAEPSLSCLFLNNKRCTVDKLRRYCYEIPNDLCMVIRNNMTINLPFPLNQYYAAKDIQLKQQQILMKQKFCDTEKEEIKSKVD